MHTGHATEEDEDTGEELGTEDDIEGVLDGCWTIEIGADSAGDRYVGRGAAV